MEKRPLSLTLLSGFLFTVGLSFLGQIFYNEGYHLSEWGSAYNKLTNLNKLIILFSFANGLLAWRASIWLWPALSLQVAFVIWNNYLVGAYGFQVDPLMANLASFVFIGVCTCAVTARSKIVLTRPEKRWWLHQKRHLRKLEVALQKGTEKVVGYTFDISNTGAFVACEGELAKLGADSKVKMTFNPRNSRAFTLDAKIVRFNEKSGRYPEGIGLAFNKDSIFQRLKIKKMLSE